MPNATSDLCDLPDFRSRRLASNERIAAILAIWIASLIVCCGPVIADPDLWGHTLYGLRSIEQGVWLEKTDSYSYTANGADWVNHEWLTEYIFALLWQSMGSPGLILWRDALALVLMSIALWGAMKERVSVGAALAVLGLNAECLSNFFVFVRPQLVTLVLFAATLVLLRLRWQGRARRLVWLLPLIFVFWTNSHGGFLAGLALIATFCFCGVLTAVYRQEHRRRGIELLSILAASVAATLITPYGINLYAMLTDHLLPRQIVREWQPLWSVRQSLGYYVPFLLIAIALLRSKRWQWIDLLVLLAVGYQAVSHIRHIGLLCVTTLIVLPGPITEALERLFPRVSETWASHDRRHLRTAAVAAASLFLMALSLETGWRLWRAGVRPWDVAVETNSDTPGVPMRAVFFLAERGIKGNMLTSYGWAQYVLWHRFPESHVAFDGRYRTVYSRELEDCLIDFRKGRQSKDHQTPLLHSYGTQIVLLPVGHPGRTFLEDEPGWVRAYSDGQAVIYIRNGTVETMDNASSAAAPLIKTDTVERWQRFPAGPLQRRDK